VRGLAQQINGNFLIEQGTGGSAFLVSFPANREE
jgi:hypothetical protein